MTAIFLLLLAGLLVLFAFNRDAFWEQIAGPADLGPYDFTQGKRRSVPNDALACTPGVCNSQPEVALAVFDESPEALMRRVTAIVMAGPESALRADDASNPVHARFVIRTRLLRYPDTLDVEAAPLADGRSGLRLYSRSKLGRNDYGANKARLEAIAGRL